MPGPVFLDGGTVSLHPIEDEDLDFCLRGVNEPSVWRATDLAGPTTERAEREWLDAVSADDDELALLICADGSPAGVIGLSEIDRTHGTARIGFWIAPDRRGNGYATAAVELLVGYAFDHLRLHRVEGDVYAFNDASRRVPEIAGFGEEGVRREAAFVDGEHVDVHRYGLLILVAVILLLTSLCYLRRQTLSAWILNSSFHVLTATSMKTEWSGPAGDAAG